MLRVICAVAACSCYSPRETKWTTRDGWRSFRIICTVLTYSRMLWIGDRFVRGRYADELSKLGGAFAVARQTDVSDLSRAVEAWSDRSMRMVGSGGSFSTASFAAYLHEQHTGHLARAVTPLEAVSGTFPNAGVACFSASGRNRDIIAAFREASRREAMPLAALVLAEESPLADVSARSQYSTVIAKHDIAYVDGFLAVASLLASCLLLLRAYRDVMGLEENDVPQSLDALVAETTSLARIDELLESLEEVTAKPYISVLYTPSLAPTAIDLESRFVEAALGSLHIADLRNFGHGRHVWFAKRAESTGALALIGDGLEALGSKTLHLLPPNVTTASVQFRGAWDMQAFAGVVVGLHVAQSAGQSAGIDPGRPGVPAFGRALYRLAPQSQRTTQADRNKHAALRRKGLRQCDGEGEAHYQEALSRFNSTAFDAMVLDYDGTLCDTSARFEPLSSEVAEQLTRLCMSGATIGVATGRGPSAGNSLRRALPLEVHDRIVVGYYNGAMVLPLCDETDPLLPELPDSHPVLDALRADLIFRGAEVRTRNCAQISIGLGDDLPADRAVGRALYLLQSLSLVGGVVASSHSIDLLLQNQSKLKVVGALRAMLNTDGPILRIGDRGAWPGNDSELLDDRFGLSVDSTSTHPEHCWALAPAGVVGLQATLFYLGRTKWTRRGGRIRLTAGARGR